GHVIPAFHPGDLTLHTLSQSSTAATNASAGFNPNSQTVTLTGSVTNAAGPVNGGTFTFTVAGLGSVTSGTVSNGTASATLTLPGGTAAGSYLVTTAYSGTSNFDPSSNTTGRLTINPAGTTTAVSATPAAAVYGQPVTFTAGVTVNAPGAGTPTGAVDFVDVTTGTDLGSRPLSGGSAQLTTTSLGVTSHTITATYGGDGNFTASSGAT